MPDFSLSIWILITFYAVMVGLAKNGVPGIGLLGAVALITFGEGWIPVKERVGFMLPLLLAGDIFALIYYRRHAVWRHVIRLLPWAVAGILIGHYAIGCIDDWVMKRTVGGLVILLLAVDLWRRRQGAAAEVPTQLWFAAAIGLLAGFATNVAVDISENADLRISRFFPGFSTIADFDLSPGEHRLEVLYLDQYGNIIRSNDLGTIRVNPRALNLYESFCLQ